MQKDYTFILDNILNYFYDHSSEQIIPSNIKSNFDLNETLFYAAIEKIHRSSHIDKLNNERAEKAVCQINFDGILFKESGGYQITKNNTQKENRIKSVKDWLLIGGTWLAGLGALSLTIWEIYKHFYLHID